MIESVDSDPWGRPYRIVTKKLRPSAPPLTENMDPELLDNVIGTLFPRRDNNETSAPAPTIIDGTAPTDWNEELRVTAEELLEAAKKVASRDVAPGPDGIPGRV